MGGSPCSRGFGPYETYRFRKIIVNSARTELARPPHAVRRRPKRFRASREACNTPSDQLRFFGNAGILTNLPTRRTRGSTHRDFTFDVGHNRIICQTLKNKALLVHHVICEKRIKNKNFPEYSSSSFNKHSLNPLITAFFPPLARRSLGALRPSPHLFCNARTGTERLQRSRGMAAPKRRRFQPERRRPRGASAQAAEGLCRPFPGGRNPSAKLQETGQN